MGSQKNTSKMAVSLRFLLVISSAIFVVGYQQYQLYELRNAVHELKETSNDLRRQLKGQQTVRLITAPPAMGGQGRLRFPIEVERAMMGDSIRLGPQNIRPVR